MLTLVCTVASISLCFEWSHSLRDAYETFYRTQMNSLFVMSLLHGCLCPRPRLQTGVSRSTFLPFVEFLRYYFGHVVPSSRGSRYRESR